MKKVYIITIKEQVDSYFNEVKTTQKAFDSEDKAIAYLNKKFHEFWDNNDIEELGVYEHKSYSSFHLQENGDTMYPSASSWVVDGGLTILDVE